MEPLSYLADYRSYIPLLAEHLYHQFNCFDSTCTLTSYKEKLNQDCNHTQLPITYIIQQNHTLWGSASLCINDLESHSHLTPWLANVYTFAAYRKRGVGRSLVKQVILQAKNLGFDKLYLFTADKTAWYQKLDWQIIDHSSLNGIPIIIMEYDLTSAGT